MIVPYISANSQSLIAAAQAVNAGSRACLPVGRTAGRPSNGGFAPQGDLLFLSQEKEAKELGQKLQLSAELLFVSTTDARTRQESLATGN